MQIYNKDGHYITLPDQYEDYVASDDHFDGVQSRYVCDEDWLFEWWQAEQKAIESIDQWYEDCISAIRSLSEQEEEKQGGYNYSGEDALERFKEWYDREIWIPETGYTGYQDIVKKLEDPKVIAANIFDLASSSSGS